MKYTIRIRRQNSRDAEAFWQAFELETEENMTVAAVLLELNRRSPLTDVSGSAADPIGWEYGCLVRKCGGCAMRINGIPRLACATFLQELHGTVVTLEPLSKFPLVRDLIVDRSAVFEALRKARLWLESEAYMPSHTHAARYGSAKCLLCGCCLEVCPNFAVSGAFSGAVLPVNAFRILEEEQNTEHDRQVVDQYRKQYFEGCGKSLACHDICPAGVPVEELMVRSNAAAVWKR